MVNSGSVFFDRIRAMPEGLWPILAIVAIVVVYVLARVFQYMRLSEQQWREVDKSKLKTWEDED